MFSVFANETKSVPMFVVAETPEEAVRITHFGSVSDWQRVPDEQLVTQAGETCTAREWVDYYFAALLVKVKELEAECRAYRVRNRGWGSRL